MTDPAALPLSGIRVIDLTSVVLGPFTTQLLAEMGADVIKVESPQGDTNRKIGPARHAGMAALFLQLNRGKRSIVLDLKSAQGRGCLLDLIRTADVFISNVRPKAMKRLGLGYDDIKAVRPDIISVGLVGYDQRGPLADQPAYDDLIQGAVGLPKLFQRAGAGEPRYLPVVMADRTVALVAVNHVLAAIINRMKTGEGQDIEIPMYETMAHFILSDHLGGMTFEPTEGPVGYSRILAADRKPYRTRDGYVCALIYNERHFERFCHIADRPELLGDIRFKDLTERTNHIGEFYAIITDIMVERTTEEWLSLFRGNDIPAMPLNDLEDLFTEPQLQASGLIAFEDHPSEGKIRSLNVTARWSSHQPRTGHPAPRLGEHTAELLRSIGRSDIEIARICRASAAACDLMTRDDA